MGFELRFLDTEITAWGGMAVMKPMLDHWEFDQAMQESGLLKPHSHRGIRAKQVINLKMAVDRPHSSLSSD